VDAVAALAPPPLPLLTARLLSLFTSFAGLLANLLAPLASFLAALPRLFTAILVRPVRFRLCKRRSR
jgi:hypothetical protein